MGPRDEGLWDGGGRDKGTWLRTSETSGTSGTGDCGVFVRPLTCRVALLCFYHSCTATVRVKVLAGGVSFSQGRA